MNKLLDSLHKKILNHKFAEVVSEEEIWELVKAKERGDGWIPCSSGERPVVPEGKDYVDVLITTLPYFHYETENNWEASEYYEDIGFNTQKTVIAWRYSIQPYVNGE